MTPPPPSHRRVELIITLLVIAALAAFAIPRFLRAQRAAKERACLENIAAIQRDIEIFQLAGDESPPPSLDALYGPGKTSAAPPACPLKGRYTLAPGGGVACDHE